MATIRPPLLSSTLEAQAFGGVDQPKDELHRLASETGNITYQRRDVSHTKDSNGNDERTARLTTNLVSAITGEPLSMEVLAYEEAGYGSLAISVYDGVVFKDPL